MMNVMTTMGSARLCVSRIMVVCCVVCSTNIDVKIILPCKPMRNLYQGTKSLYFIEVHVACFCVAAAVARSQNELCSG